MGPGMVDGYFLHGMGWFGWFFMVVFWAIVILAILSLVRWLAASSRRLESRESPESPMEILKRRYARGEIDKREFEEKKKDLL